MSERTEYRVGVAGTNGAVGRTVLEVLAERDFPASEIVPFDSRVTDSKGSRPEIPKVDLMICAVDSAFSAKWVPQFVERGIVVIDNTSHFRMDEDIPLVVAEVNPDMLYFHKGIIANPNCATIQLCVTLQPIHEEVGLERVIVSTYQAVSGAGHRAVTELHTQTADVQAGRTTRSEVLPNQIADNVIPQVETFADGDDYTTEERKIQQETKKILSLDGTVGISATCVRVPVVTGHAESVNIQTREKLSAEACQELLEESPGVVVMDVPGQEYYPMPLTAAGQDMVQVGRIREDPSHERALNLWIAADNLRKGAATNVVQIAEELHKRGLIHA